MLQIQNSSKQNGGEGGVGGGGGGGVKPRYASSCEILLLIKAVLLMYSCKTDIPERDR